MYLPSDTPLRIPLIQMWIKITAFSARETLKYSKVEHSTTRMTI